MVDDRARAVHVGGEERVSSPSQHELHPNVNASINNKQVVDEGMQGTMRATIGVIDRRIVDR